jgi:hypothetical protein
MYLLQATTEDQTYACVMLYWARRYSLIGPVLFPRTRTLKPRFEGEGGFLEPSRVRLRCQLLRQRFTPYTGGLLRGNAAWIRE